LYKKLPLYEKLKYNSTIPLKSVFVVSNWLSPDLKSILSRLKPGIDYLPPLNFIPLKRTLVIAFSILALSGYSQPLSKTEKQILQQTEKDARATLDLLKESVNINSGTYNIPGVRMTGEVFARELRALGFAVEWVSLPDSMKRAGHLVAHRKGKKGKKILLLGHLDTVFEPDMPANPFRMLNDSTATGQGIVDDKGGVVVIIAALKALYREKLLEDATITVYLTGDEEKAGNPSGISRRDLIERARQHDLVLSFEGAQGMNSIVTARRGSSEWRLTVEAEQAHSSGIFGQAGYGAIYEATRIINEFREKLGNEKYLTFNPGLFIGGSEMNYNEAAQKGETSGKTNIISPRTVVIGDLRFITEEQREKARENMRRIVAQHLPGTKASITFKDGIPSMPPTAGNDTLLQKVNAISLALGYGEVKAGDPGSRGAGDISYVAKYLDGLDGLGASGHGSHAPGEIINLYELPKLINRTALLIYRLTR
jgi:glutamate carboxypeptidase